MDQLAGKINSLAESVENVTGNLSLINDTIERYVVNESFLNQPVFSLTKIPSSSCRLNWFERESCISHTSRRKLQSHEACVVIITEMHVLFATLVRGDFGGSFSSSEVPPLS